MEITSPPVEVDELDRPVWGAAQIAAIIGRSPRSTHNLLSRGLLPARRIGGRWTSTRRKLMAIWENLDEEAA